MSQKDTLTRHKIIIQTLRKKPSNFDEILYRIEQETSLTDSPISISKRTFQRDIIDISDLYKIEIKYNRASKNYEIIEQEKDKYQERMFEALDLFQALNLNDSISKYIQFDPRKPLGTQHIHAILHAIQNKFQIKFYYKKFWKENPEIRTIEPYLLKEFRNRWYVFGFDIDKKSVRTFGLDRIQAIQVLPIKFQFPKQINIEEYFRDSFGVFGKNSGGKQEIILQFFNNQGEYIKTMPLHHSQQIIEEKGDETIVKLHVAPTHDFLMELLHFGELVKVIKPQSIAQEIKEKLESALNLYK